MIGSLSVSQTLASLGMCLEGIKPLVPKSGHKDPLEIFVNRQHHGQTEGEWALAQISLDLNLGPALNSVTLEE